MPGLLDDLDPQAGSLLGDLDPGAPSSDELDASAHVQYVGELQARGRRGREQAEALANPIGAGGGGPAGPGSQNYVGPLPNEEHIRNALGLDQGLPSSLPSRGVLPSMGAGFVDMGRQAIAGAGETMGYPMLTGTRWQAADAAAKAAADFAPPGLPERLAYGAGATLPTIAGVAASRGRMAASVAPAIARAMQVPAEVGASSLASNMADPRQTPQEAIVNAAIETLGTRAGGAFEPLFKTPIGQLPRQMALEGLEEGATGAAQDVSSQLLGSDANGSVDVLRALQAGGEGAILGSTMAGALGVPRAAGDALADRAAIGPNPLGVGPEERARLEDLWDYPGADPAARIDLRHTTLSPEDEAALRIPDVSRQFGQIQNPDPDTAEPVDDPLDARLYDTGQLSRAARMDRAAGDTVADNSLGRGMDARARNMEAPTQVIPPRFDRGAPSRQQLEAERLASEEGGATAANLAAIEGEQETEASRLATAKEQGKREALETINRFRAPDDQMTPEMVGLPAAEVGMRPGRAAAAQPPSARPAPAPAPVLAPAADPVAAARAAAQERAASLAEEEGGTPEATPAPATDPVLAHIATLPAEQQAVAKASLAGWDYAADPAGAIANVANVLQMTKERADKAAGKAARAVPGQPGARGGSQRGAPAVAAPSAVSPVAPVVAPADQGRPGVSPSPADAGRAPNAPAAPAPAAPAAPSTKAAPVAPKSVPVASVADLHRGLREVYGLSEDQAEAATALAKARASALGEHPDAFVKRTISEVRQATDKEAKKASATDHGASLFAEDGRAALVAFTNPDATTAAHELSHIFRRTLSASDQRIAGMWAGARKQADGSMKWGETAEEKFARGFERYLRDGIAPTPALRGIFAKFKAWMRSVYQATKGTPLEHQLSPEVRALFDRMLTPTTKTTEESNAPDVSNPVPGAQAGKAPSDDARGPGVQGPPESVEQTPERDAGGAAPPEAGKAPAETPAPVGRPDLANPAESDEARAAVDKLDEQAKAKPKEVRHEEEVTKAADAIMGDAAQRSALTERIKAGDTLNDAETMAAKRIVDGSVQAAIKADSDAAWKEAGALHAGYREGGSEQARAFAMRHDTKQTPAERMRGLVMDATMTPPRNLDKALQSARAAIRKAGKGADRTRLQAAVTKAEQAIDKNLADVRQELKRQGVDLLYQGDNPAILASQVNAALSANATWSDARHEWYTAAIMSAPRTIIVNLAGTPIHAAWKGIANRTVEAAMNAVSGNRVKGAAQFKDVGTVLAGIFNSRNFLGAVADGFRTLKYERPVFMGQVVPQDGEQRGPAVSGALVKGWRNGLLKTGAQVLLDKAGYFPRAVFGAQRAGDQFWKSWVARVEVAIEADKIGRTRGYEGDELSQLVRDQIDDLDSEAWSKAKDSAVEFAFQDEGGELRQRAVHAGNWVRNLGVGTHRPILYLIPFLNTPLAIKFGAVQASPLGTLRMAAKWVNHMQGREVYSADQVMKDAAQQLVGWAVFGAIAAMALDDDEDGHPLLTGSGEFDSGKQAMLDRNRVPSKSIRLFGTYYNYSGVEPLASFLAAGADMAKAGKDYQTTGDPGKLASGVSKTALGQLTDSTYLKGLSDIRDAMSSDSRDDSKRIKLLTNFAVSWVPNLIRQPLRSIDNTKRDTANFGKGTDWWWRAGQNLEGKVIPWSDSPAIGVWGKELTKTDDFAASDILARLVGAESVSGKGNRYDRALMAWNNDARNKTFLPMPPDRSYRDGDKTVFWTDAQYRQLAQKSGAYALEYLSGREINPKHPTQEQMDAIRDALERGRAKARVELKAALRQ